MSSTLLKLASSWTASVPGASMPCVSVRGASMSRMSMPDAYLPASGGLRGQRRAKLRDLRFEQLIQDDQGRSVFEHLIEDTNVQAPATAHVGVTVKGGVSGPYPWRRPV